MGVYFFQRLFLKFIKTILILEEPWLSFKLLKNCPYHNVLNAENGMVFLKLTH